MVGAVDARELGERVGHLGLEDLRAIDDALLLVLDLPWPLSLGQPPPTMCSAASPAHSPYGAKNSRTCHSCARACGSPPDNWRPTSLRNPRSPAGIWSWRPCPYNPSISTVQDPIPGIVRSLRQARS